LIYTEHSLWGSRLFFVPPATRFVDIFYTADQCSRAVKSNLSENLIYSAGLGRDLTLHEPLTAALRCASNCRL